MLEHQVHQAASHAAPSSPGTLPRLAAGILLAVALTGCAAGAEGAGNAAAQANNPLANMTALNFRDCYIGRIAGTDKDGNQFWVRFAKPFKLADTEWLMRASLPVNTYPVASGGAQATGIGDLNVFAAYLFDTGNPAVSFGLGPQITVAVSRVAFVVWAGRHASDTKPMNEVPVVGLVRALAEKYPCK
jgi:hypothetical protein